MTAKLTASIQGQSFPVDLTRVSALDAVVFEQSTGYPLDIKILALAQGAPEGDDEWRLVDRAIIKWLYVRQNVDPDAALAPVLATVTLFPDSPEESGDLVAPGDA